MVSEVASCERTFRGKSALSRIRRSCQSTQVSTSSRREPERSRYVWEMLESRHRRVTRTEARKGPSSTTSTPSASISSPSPS